MTAHPGREFAGSCPGTRACAVRLAWLAAITATSVVLAACGRAVDQADYPRDWPPPRPAGGGRGACPDLSGRYVMGEGVLEAVFSQPDGPDDRAIRWHTLEITRDASGRQVLGFFGRGADEARDAPPKMRSRDMPDASCREGWLHRVLGSRQDAAAPGAAGDNRVVAREALVATDGGGNLVAVEVTQRYRALSLWAPGGAHVRLPFTGSTERRWWRWRAATGDPRQPRLHPLASERAPALRALGRHLPPDAQLLSLHEEGAEHVLEVRLATPREALELGEQLRSSPELGVAEVLHRRPLPDAVVLTLRVGPPERAADEEAAPSVDLAALRERTDAMVRRLSPMLREGTVLADITPQDGGYLLRLHCPDEQALAALMSRLRESRDFGIPELRGSAPFVDGQVAATLWVSGR